MAGTRNFSENKFATPFDVHVQYRYSAGQFNGWIIERSKNFGRSWHPIGDWYATEAEAKTAADRLNALEDKQ